ncbi:hypothetical protein DPMN_112894 [Dreissena polymorpha]|uniref:Hexosyltransferase n=2 Tax=Dreissena polymorpha TaxID=45954 RepID=A0A9D4KH87_DREPO|nr:hypothetical protein DPMN_112894 [Dreissena polymorpha]
MNFNLQRTKTVFAIIAIFMGLIVVSLTYTWLDARRLSVFRFEVAADRFAKLQKGNWTQNQLFDLFKTEKMFSTHDVTYNPTKQYTVSLHQRNVTKSAFLNGASTKLVRVTTVANGTSMQPIRFNTIENGTSMTPIGSTTIAVRSNRTFNIDLSRLFATMTSVKLPTRITSTLPYDNSDGRPDECSNCFPMDFTSMISPDRLCDGGRVNLLIVVLSSVTNRLARESIRSTWGSLCNSMNSIIRLAFVIGNNLNKNDNFLLLEESGKFNDIIQADFRDTYANLTYKTMTGLKWSHTHCSNAKYVMKTDDDMFINTEVLPILLQAAPKRNFMGGFCWGPSSPHRQTSSKWYVSITQYRKPLFPAMCSGTGYLLSTDVVGNIVKVARNIPFFYLEDVYVAICVNKFGVSPVNLAGFSNMFVNSSPCVYRNSVITSHQLPPETLTRYWEESRTCPLSPLSPTQVFHSRVV